MLVANLEKQLRDFALKIEFRVNPGEVLILLGTVITSYSIHYTKLYETD